MLNRNVETFIGCESDYEEANIVMFGAPFDSTVSFRPGARFGSASMRHESFGIETYSPYQDKDLEDCAIFDSGDLELCIGNSALALHEIEARARIILEDGKLPLMLGGEHLVTLGAVRAVVDKYPELHVIQFDAHADLRDEYLGEKLSHACVMRRCHELLGDGHIHQFGVRSGERLEFEWAKQGHTNLCKFNFDGIEKTITSLKDKPVYLTIDLDVLDSAVLPGTGTPEAGGVSFMELLHAMLKVCQGCQIVGCDVNELSPSLDLSGASTATACKIVRELLLAL